jgi:hypothetical protein
MALGVIVIHIFRKKNSSRIIKIRMQAWTRNLGWFAWHVTSGLDKRFKPGGKPRQSLGASLLRRHPHPKTA